MSGINVAKFMPLLILEKGKVGRYRKARAFDGCVLGLIDFLFGQTTLS